MKKALAIVCGLLLAGTQFVPAQAPLMDTAGARCSALPCCSDCSKCCAAPSAPASQPVSAPVSSFSSQDPSATAAPAAVAWTLPAPEPVALPDFNSFLTSSVTAPLYARDSARLI